MPNVQTNKTDTSVVALTGTDAPKDATGKPVAPKLLAAAKHVRNDKAKGKEATSGPKAEAVAATKRFDDMKRRRVSILAAHGNEIPGTATEAASAIISAIPDVARAEANVAIRGVARLAIALMPAALWLLSPKAAKQQIAADATAPAKLLTFVRSQAGKVELSVKRRVNVPGTNVTPVQAVPLWEQVSGATWNVACKAAFLLALPDSGARIGFAPGDKLPGNTIITDVVFHKSGKIPAVCAPFNVIAPKLFRGIAASPNAKGMYAGADPVPNKDDSLRYLNGDMVSALFAHWYAGADLSFDTERKNKEGVPTGLLMPYRAARTGASANAGQGNATSLADAIGQFGDDATKGLIALADTCKGARDLPAVSQILKLSSPLEFAAAVFALARIMAEKLGPDTLGTETFCRHAVGVELAELQDATCARVSDPDKQGERFTLNPRDGKRLRRLEMTAAPIVPSERSADKEGKAA